MARQFPIRGSGGLPLIVNETTAKQYPLRDLILNDTTPASGAITGALVITQAAQTLAATGTVPSAGVTGTLAITQAAQTLVATGGLQVGGTLAVTEAVDTLAATGGPRTGGTLTVTEVADTLTAAGGLTAGAILVATQVAQALSATGGPRVGGTLAATEAADTLVAAGGSVVQGTLAVTEAADTLVAAASSFTTASLSITEAADTLNATGAVISGISGSLVLTQAAQTIAAAGTVRVSGTLAATEAVDTLAGAASTQILAGLGGFGGGTATTFDPAKTYTPTLTLSNGNLTVAKLASAPAYDNTFSTPSQGGAKLYVEIKIDQTQNGGRNAVGIGLNTSLLHNSWIGDSANAYGWYCGDVNLYHNGASQGTAPVYITGHTLAIAVDRVANTLQLRNVSTASAWAGPFSIADFAGKEISVAATLYDLVKYTANFDGAWLGTPPSAGYTAWTVAGGLTQAGQTLSATGSVLSGIGGTLAITQAGQTLAASATLGAVTATLARTQAAQSLLGAAEGVVSATLARTQADQTISASGRLSVGAALLLIQASQIVVAEASSQVAAALARRQDDHIVAGFGTTGNVEARVMIFA